LVKVFIWFFGVRPAADCGRAFLLRSLHFSPVHYFFCIYFALGIDKYKNGCIFVSSNAMKRASKKRNHGKATN
jgi:hypothetical protein